MSGRYAQAWFLFIDQAGELSPDPAAACVTVAATHAGRVVVNVPDGLELAADAAERIAERVTDAVRIARDPESRFAV